MKVLLNPHIPEAWNGILEERPRVKKVKARFLLQELYQRSSILKNKKLTNFSVK